jgi:hypothetical protein
MGQTEYFGSAQLILAHMHLKIECTRETVMLSLTDNIHGSGEITWTITKYFINNSDSAMIILVVWMCVTKRKITNTLKTPLLLIPEFNSGNILRLSSVMVHKYLLLTLLNPMCIGQTSREPTAGHHLVWRIEPLGDCGCSMF